MLQKSRNKDVVERVLRLGKSYFGDNIQLRCLKIDSPVGEAGGDLPFFAFVVSSKTEKLAVNRNLLKRRGGHIIRELGDLKEPNTACVFFFKKGAVSLIFDKLKEQIVFLLKKAKLKE
ncbi:MAG: ribonuclease P protein component [Patescibacteria group bacterium]